MVAFMGRDELGKLFSASLNDVFHIAHHVQTQYCGKPTRDHHNPDREKATENILELTSCFNSRDIPTLATVFCDKSDWLSNEEAGLHQFLQSNAYRIEQSYRGSAYYFLQKSEKEKAVHILTGFNAGLCVLESALDNLRPKDATLIVVEDGIANGTIGKKISKEAALQEMQDAGWKIAKTEDICYAVRKTRSPITRLCG